jgi:L-glyceraldehyde 3-phosphate reductase
MYVPHNQRYGKMIYRRCGSSGLRLPAISLGLWHNFGGVDAFENMRDMLCRAFDLGITHFDLANNYGPPPGAAEENFGRALRADLGAWRDELIVSTKAGYLMWPGPYGEWGSRKYLLASLDQSLKRMGLDYVDIFYSHRPDPDTPVEETMSALDSAVRAGKALYAGISNYNAEQTARAVTVLRQLGTPCLIHQMKYSMFVRTAEEGLFERLAEEGVGGIAFSPLAQGLLSDRYVEGIPDGSRASKPGTFLKKTDVTEARLSQVRALHQIAGKRGQTLAQMALAWVLRQGVMASALVGASRREQIEQCAGALEHVAFDAEELATINGILTAGLKPPAG